MNVWKEGDACLIHSNPTFKRSLFAWWLPHITLLSPSPSLNFNNPAMTAAQVLAGLFLLFALYCGIDPFKHSAISDFPNFQSHYVDLPDWSSLPTEKDPANLLQRSEIKFLNQIQGPESMAFDPLGRGPYTGIADGRVVFWDGLKWTDFAYTSPNRFLLFPFSFLFVFWHSVVFNLVIY